jgi:hypothetical protein
MCRDVQQQHSLVVETLSSVTKERDSSLDALSELRQKVELLTTDKTYLKRLRDGARTGWDDSKRNRGAKIRWEERETGSERGGMREMEAGRGKSWEEGGGRKEGRREKGGRKEGGERSGRRERDGRKEGGKEGGRGKSWVEGGRREGDGRKEG